MSTTPSSPPPVNVAELKRHFSDYLDRVSNRGERVVVRRRSRDVAVLVPISEADQMPSAPRFSGLGLVAAVGAWAQDAAQDAEVDRFVADIRSARRRTRDRKVPPLE